MNISKIAREWHLISVREPHIDCCSHGRPDHQIMLNQLAEAMGVMIPSTQATPAQIWTGLLEIIEHQFRNAERVDGGWDTPTVTR